jgi:hypothetical protein
VSEEANASTCYVKENTANPSYTAKAISAFFRCPLVHGTTDIYDVLFFLGEREKEWDTVK